MHRTRGGLRGPNALRDWPQITLEARAMDAAGYTRLETSETLGVSVTWLRKTLGRVDYHRGCPHPDRHRRLVEELHWQGLTLGQIHYKTHIPKSTAHEWLSRLA